VEVAGVADRSFEEFVAGTLPQLSRYARALTSDRHAAQDLTQETLVKVAGSWRRVREDGNPLGYATTVMFRTYVSWWRARRRRPDPLTLVDEPVAVTDGYATVENRLVLRAALAGLSRLQRAVLVATYLDDATDEAIAELVGRSPSTVRSLRRRGLQALRSVLAPPGNGGGPPGAAPSHTNNGVVQHTGVELGEVAKERMHHG
jgi:RNA polymerase sigma-70 factor (sigma-E family)